MTSREAPAPAPQAARGLGRRRDDRRVPGEAEVVVAGEVDDRVVHRARRQRAAQPGPVALGGLLGEPVAPRPGGAHATTAAASIAAQIRATSSSVVTYGGIV